ncbi:hypothetical protein F2Q69_00014318 [Brassica cretica]|uniref:Uncharacterized protein n=1 Tax=Brassica cretica TaxID=69181 RepID=A0A8S9R969_BRACR|nr:hypothetical protein F2Q69_00014318 [Brassica cretica]
MPRIKDSEDIPKKHFLGLFVGISSDISDGTVIGNIPREKRYRNSPTNFGRRNIPRNLCRWNIPSKCIRRDIPRRYALGIFKGTLAVGIFRETFAVGIFRGSVSVGIFRGDMPSEYSKEVVKETTGTARSGTSSSSSPSFAHSASSLPPIPPLDPPSFAPTQAEHIPHNTIINLPGVLVDFIVMVVLRIPVIRDISHVRLIAAVFGVGVGVFDSGDMTDLESSFLQLKAFLILAQTISAYSTSARKQDDLRQLATRSARWTARVPHLSNQTARDNISSRSDQFQLAVHLFGGPFNPT